jgi:hypothetical protein
MVKRLALVPAMVLAAMWISPAGVPAHAVVAGRLPPCVSWTPAHVRHVIGFPPHQSWPHPLINRSRNSDGFLPLSADAGHVLVGMYQKAIRKDGRIPLAIFTRNGRLRSLPPSAFPHFQLARTQLEYPWIVGVRSAQQPPDDWVLYAANVVTGRHFILDHGNGIAAPVTRVYPDFELNRGRVVWNDAAYRFRGVPPAYLWNRLDLFNVETGKKSVIASTSNGHTLYLEPTLWEDTLVWVRTNALSMARTDNPVYDLVLTYLGSHTITILTHNTRGPYSMAPSLWWHYLLYVQTRDPYAGGRIYLRDLNRGLHIGPRSRGTFLASGEWPQWDNGVAYWGPGDVYVPGTGTVWTFQDLKYMSDLHHFKYTWEITGWHDAGSLVVMRAIHNTLGHKVYFIWHFPPAEGTLCSSAGGVG